MRGPRLALVAVVIAALSVAACTASPPRPDSSLPRPIATSGTLRVTGPVSVPATGAMVGAWVKPDGSLTQTSRVDAVFGLESWLGRTLDIVNTYRRWTETFPTPSDQRLAKAGSTLMVSWATDDNQVINSGSDDPAIVTWAKSFKSFKHPILLRMRWEMDRPNLAASMGSGADFVAAWNHVRAIFTAQQVTNVSWVWCPTAAGFTGGTAQAFYPGDAAVDWICVDVYSSSKLQPLPALLGPFLNWAAAHPKPIVIGEFGVAGVYDGTDRAAWLATAATEFQANPQIKAVCYFDSDPDRSPPTLRFSLPPGSTELTAFATMARAPYFNPHRLDLSP
jgi:hypothetical protein